MHILNSCNSSLSDSAVVVLATVVVLAGALEVDIDVDGAVVVDNLTNDKMFDPLHRFNPNSLKSQAYFRRKFFGNGDVGDNFGMLMPDASVKR